ncbi:eCIS core domain-containing protein [Roseovarius sp. D22-M7]|uniref:eCIS core domain-containing protein n=1 Tax=Roseovarius sp. D22-M7 TaxID=3127116 RepID=UPI0030104935
MAAPQHVQKAPVTSERKPMTIGPARDRFEAEADRIANRVVSPPAAAMPPPAISPVPGAGIARKRAGAAPEEPEEPTPPLTTLAQKSPMPAASPPEEPEDPLDSILGQRDASGAGPAQAPAGVTAAVNGMRGGGAPLPGATRGRMEGSIGRDLSGVRLHNSAAAASTARAINARAFTVGNDVFFGQGAFQPQTSAGQRLLAHELVHTVQQSGGSARAQRAVIQRTPTGDGSEIDTSDTGGTATNGTPPPPAGLFEEDDLRIDLRPAKKVMQVEKLELPPAPTERKGIATAAISPAGTDNVSGLPNYSGGSVTLHRATPRGGSARATWRSYQQAAMAGLSLSGKLPTATENAEESQSGPYITQKNGENFYFLMPKNVDDAQEVIMGTEAELKQAQQVLQPEWDKAGRAAEFDVDHILELQIGGADAGSNMWLLDSSFNRSSGSSIAQWIRSSIRSTLRAARSDSDFMERAREANISVPGSTQSDVTRVKHEWDIVFTNVEEKAANTTLHADKYWSKSELQRGDHLTSDRVRFLTLDELQGYGFAFDAAGTTPRQFNVFGSPNGGKFIPFQIRNGEVRRPREFFVGLRYENASYGENGLILTISRHRRRRNDPFVTEEERTRDITIAPQPHLGNAGFMSTGELTSLFGVPFRYFSPTAFASVYITPDGMLRADGTISVSKLILPNISIPIFIDGTDVGIAFPIPEDSLSFGPLTVSEPTLEIGMGEDGFFIAGGATVTVDQLGSGRIEARGTNDNVVLSGDFALTMDFLDEAEVSLSYSVAENQLSGSVDASVETDRLPGVTGGSVHVEFTNDTIGVSGTIDLAPPMEGGSLTVSYLPETGLTIGADNLPLPADQVPGISSATVSISANRAPDTGQWHVSGSGSADIETTGVTGSIKVSYDDGAFLISGTGEVAIGQATGEVSLTVTNMPLDEEGNPVEGEIADSFSIWGRGSVTIELGEILTGTAGIEYTPDGRVIISGEIALPSSFEVFEREDFSRRLLSLETPDFPIWGVSIAGVGFGIFASADGYVDLEAWIGPATIEDARIGATMDLEHPEDLSVTGGARFVVPAYGGLKLGLGGNIYARAAVAYARGRVGITGELGLEVGGGIDIGVDWNRQDGLSLDASARVEASPKFRIGLEASVSAGVNLGLTSVDRELGSWDTTLGEFGPDMTLGVRMPARWSEANGLEMSLDDIEVQRPSINARDILDSAFDSVV